jgi:hypothetical protein
MTHPERKHLEECLHCYLDTVTGMMADAYAARTHADIVTGIEWLTA